jgi:FAD/FMN-containing dehydrogenase
MQPYGSGKGYGNFCERPTDPAAFYGPEAYDRLRRVKADVDPGDLFQGNHQIPPAA